MKDNITLVQGVSTCVRNFDEIKDFFGSIFENIILLGELGLSPEMFNQLRNLQKKAKELKGDVRVLRRSVQTQALTIRETIKDTFLRFKYVGQIKRLLFNLIRFVNLVPSFYRVVAMAGNDQWMQGDPEKSRIHREKEYHKQEMLTLNKDLE